MIWLLRLVCSVPLLHSLIPIQTGGKGECTVYCRVQRVTTVVDRRGSVLISVIYLLVWAQIVPVAASALTRSSGHCWP